MLFFFLFTVVDGAQSRARVWAVSPRRHAMATESPAGPNARSLRQHSGSSHTRLRLPTLLGRMAALRLALPFEG